jgi:hypothetical protein
VTRPTEIRVTPEQLAELKSMCIGDPDVLPMWPAIMGIPVIVEHDWSRTTLVRNGWTWQDLYNAVKE